MTMSEASIFDIDYAFPDLDPARARESLRFAAVELSDRRSSFFIRWTPRAASIGPLVEPRAGHRSHPPAVAPMIRP